MSTAETSHHSLRDLLVQRYDEFRQRLYSRLGSHQLAEDALQETWLRIERMQEGTRVHHPAAYLFRIAMNVAEEQRRKHARVMTLDEVDDLYQMADELADPAREALGEQEIRIFRRALAELPRRRRAIVTAARIEDTPHAEIAERFGVSLRTVEKELRAGLQHCCERLERDYAPRYGPRQKRPTQS
ncbi:MULTISPECIES: RNA polymerase sigma factor [Alloalcanivorax]|jgi:RNA polymerase sigma factor (sigma-70 family)|uniref:RNA polymerase sigma factor n=2 Tax=Alloalcanivorax TaxID=3020832 RepID=A0A9Q3W3G5_9GAMM|nr:MULTISPECIES: RNA polymerase sigma factor [Alloalcanivorax]ERS14980.1 RNA polymerase sigma factor [Alcanivorax sp. PN-3]KYZ86684.1 RNA polymerase subunit sigma [Alcanivorax sp. KX64203]MBA4722544.1 RNA polymerase sigma factor [Alcanivorax sp.]ARB44765.1 RNA polymerase subunit sigma [Alloalcanivorax xenomutans]MCE7507132.1 RNA polymerase sigma factor [Alloalcanivorax xenomutans]|tara:strand:- start:510 stop:1067 length:558 start_codon:yes stop_codon:yes gene_type:complete